MGFRRWGMLLAGLLEVAGLAAPAFAALSDRAACAAAGQAAEQAAALPANMLLAVGLVESGRDDPANGRPAPWPWTVNVDGAGRFFGDEADAAAFVRLAQSSGAADVDVGCFQVSLRYHGDAFASLDQAFDPAANARAAAGFLARLKGQTGSWGDAIADYHSAAPQLGLPYRRRVLAAWQDLGPLPAGLAAYAAADAAAADAVAADAVDLVVIRQAPAARLVRVFTMDDPAGAGPYPGLPRVISP